MISRAYTRVISYGRNSPDQAGHGFFPVAATGEAVEHGLGSRWRQLEHRAEVERAAAFGRAVEIAGRVGNQAGLRDCGLAISTRAPITTVIRRRCSS